MYLDLGTGSLIISAIIGMIAAIPVLAGVYRKKLISFFRRMRNGSKST